MEYNRTTNNMGNSFYYMVNTFVKSLTITLIMWLSCYIIFSLMQMNFNYCTWSGTAVIVSQGLTILTAFFAFFMFIYEQIEG